MPTSPPPRTRRSRAVALALTVFALGALTAAAQSALVPLAPPQLVPTTGGFGGVLPAIATAPDGRFIVAYPGGTTEEDVALRYQLFDPAGQALTGELVATTGRVVVALPEALQQRELQPRFIEPFYYSRPRAAMNAAGESLLVWSGGPGSEIDIRARLIRRNGNPAGPEFVVNTSIPGIQGVPAVAATTEGWVVAWQTPAFDGVRARLYDTAGVPLGGEVVVNDQTGVQYQPALAGLPGGGFLVAWTGEVPSDENGQVLVRRFDADGTPTGPSFAANTTGAGNQSDPAIAVDPTGGYLVSWTGDGDKIDVFAQRFAADDGKVGPENRANATAAQLQFASAVGLDEVGRGVVAWEQQDFNASGPFVEALFARPYASSGLPLAGELQITGDPAHSPRYNPALAVDAGGDVLYAGSGEDGGVYLRRFTQPCVAGPSVLCLQGGRFKVEASWRTNQGTNGLGQAVALTADTGYFWFFNPANVEMVVKVLNGCPANQRFWAFAGGLTNVEVQLLVTDTQTGQVRSYKNPLGTQYQPIQDTAAFATCPSAVLGEEAASPDAAAEAAAIAELLRSAAPEPTPPQGVASDSCTPSATRLCLRSGRFEVEVDWRTPQGNEGEGHAVALTSDTGYFWFFNAANVEMLLKVLNGCGLNGHYWVFAGGLTNVRADITVRDTSTGAVRTYANPQGTPFQPLQDTSAFASCP